MLSIKQKKERQSLLSQFGLVGSSEIMVRAVEDALRVSESPSPVVLIGEHGTEINQFAKVIHGKRKGNLIDVDAYAYVDGESHFLRTLFKNYNETGKPLLNLAKNGTIFFKHVHVLSERHQMIFKAFVDEINRDSLDIKLVFSSQLALESLVREGLFDDALFYRISAYQITVPPLRDRKEDVEDLLRSICSVKAPTKKRIIFLREFIDLLSQQKLEGNLIDLETIVVRLLHKFSRKNTFLPEDLSAVIAR